MTNIFAQTPEKLSYQAVIRDNSDAILASQNIGMQLSILEGSASGTAIYVETQLPTTNTNGLVSLEIGMGTLVSGDFTTIDWGNNTYFIKTEIDITGGTNYTITGTSQLLSVPYALYAKTSGSSTPGPQGPAGLNGADGVDGLDGATGPMGPQGPSGLNGADGANGLDGATGPMGPQGPAGLNGADGADGLDGATGPMGPQGPAGLNGADGADGLDGATGPMGPEGPAGNDGLDGATGPMGPQGPAGLNGADGVDGLNGATGPMGPQGSAGLNGADGVDGLDGATGPMGPQGPAGLNGADGLDGATGPMGPQGPAGNDGLDGATGPMGPQGPAGNDGLDGATGPMGPQGPAGLNGADGLDGATGPMGPQGLQGETGPAGTYTAGTGIDITSGVISATGGSSTMPEYAYAYIGNASTLGAQTLTSMFPEATYVNGVVMNGSSITLHANKMYEVTVAFYIYNATGGHTFRMKDATNSAYLGTELYFGQGGSDVSYNMSMTNFLFKPSTDVNLELEKTQGTDVNLIGKIVVKEIK